MNGALVLVAVGALGVLTAIARARPEVVLGALAFVAGAYWATLAMALRLITPTEGVDLRATLTEQQGEWWDLEPESKKKGLLCSRRAGKSVLLARWLVDGAKDAGEDEWCAYVSLTRKSARENMWGELKRAAVLTGVPHVVNESALMITFAGGGSVLVGGLETVRDVERYRGKKYRRVGLDECGALRDALLRTAYTDVFEPACMDVGGEIAFGGTPGYYPKGLWWELTRDGAEEETGIPVRRWTCLDNPHLLDPAGFLERIKREKGWTDDTPTFVREYLARWVIDLGQLVFPIVPGRNTCSALPTHNGEGLQLEPSGWREVLALDFGVRDPSAIVRIAAHRDLAHRKFIVSAEKRSEWLSRDLAARIRQHKAEIVQAGHALVGIVGDTGGLGAAVAMELTRQHRLPIEAARKAEKSAQVYLTRDGLISGTILAVVGTDRPEKGPTAPLLEEWGKLGWSEKDPGQPADGDDHCSDATRYGLGRLGHYAQADATPPERKPYHEAAAEEIEREKGKALREADERAQKAARERIRRAKLTARTTRRPG